MGNLPRSEVVITSCHPRQCDLMQMVAEHLNHSVVVCYHQQQPFQQQLFTDRTRHSIRNIVITDDDGQVSNTQKDVEIPRVEAALRNPWRNAAVPAPSLLLDFMTMNKYMKAYGVTRNMFCAPAPGTDEEHTPKKPLPYYQNFAGARGSGSSKYCLGAVHNKVWKRSIDAAETKGHAIAAIYDVKWATDLYKAALVYGGNLDQYIGARTVVVVHGPGGPKDLGHTQANEMEAMNRKHIKFVLIDILSYEAL